MRKKKKENEGGHKKKKRLYTGAQEECQWKCGRVGKTQKQDLEKKPTEECTSHIEICAVWKERYKKKKRWARAGRIKREGVRG